MIHHPRISLDPIRSPYKSIKKENDLIHNNNNSSNSNNAFKSKTNYNSNKNETTTTTTTMILNSTTNKYTTTNNEDDSSNYKYNNNTEYREDSQYGKHTTYNNTTNNKNNNSFRISLNDLDSFDEVDNNGRYISYSSSSKYEYINTSITPIKATTTKENSTFYKEKEAVTIQNTFSANIIFEDDDKAADVLSNKFSAVIIFDDDDTDSLSDNNNNNVENKDSNYTNKNKTTTTSNTLTTTDNHSNNRLINKRDDDDEEEDTANISSDSSISNKVKLESYDTDMLLNKLITDMNRSALKIVDDISETYAKQKKAVRESAEKERILKMKQHNEKTQNMMRKWIQEEADSQKNLYAKRHAHIQKEYRATAEQSVLAIKNYSKQKEDEESALRKAEAERQKEIERKRKEEEDRLRISKEEELRRQKELLEKQKKAEEEAAELRRKQEEIELKKKQEEQDRLKRETDEQERLKKEAEEAEKKKLEDEKKKENEERIKKEQEEKKNQLQQNQGSLTPTSTTTGEKMNSPMPMVEKCEYLVSVSAYSEYNERIKTLGELKKYLDDYQSQVPNHISESLKENDKTINRIFNQISQSIESVNEKSHVLIELLSANTSMPYVYKSLLLSIASKTMQQVESQIVPHPSSAYAYSLVISMVCVKHPELLSIFLGQLYINCQYSVPMIAKKLKTDSNETFLEKSGYKLKPNSKTIESEEECYARMGGYIMLFAAFIQAPATQSQFGIDNGWKWIARLINMKTRRITSFLLVDFLKVAGARLLAVYKQQFAKILITLTKPEFFNSLPTDSICQASKARLQTILEKFIKTQTIDTIPGL